MTHDSQALNVCARKLKSAPIFDQIAAAVASNGADLVKKVNGIIRFEVAPDGVWLVCSVCLQLPDANKCIFVSCVCVCEKIDLKNGNGAVRVGDTKTKADLTIKVRGAHFCAIF